MLDSLLQSSASPPRDISGSAPPQEVQERCGSIWAQHFHKLFITFCLSLRLHLEKQEVEFENWCGTMDHVVLFDKAVDHRGKKTVSLHKTVLRVIRLVLSSHSLKYGVC